MAITENNILFTSNNKLESIEGFSNLTEIGGVLQIIYCSSLSDLSGFSNLVEIGDYLTLRRIDALIDMNDFGNLTMISTINMIENSSLTSLAGLERVISDLAGIKIAYNPLLSNIEGLKNIGSITGVFRIENNPMLSDCSMISICDQLPIGSTTFSIIRNMEGCNTQEEVLLSCN